MELTNAFVTRANLIGYGRQGVIKVTVQRQNGSLFTFAATLLDSALECAKMNADLYYKSQGTSRYKESKKRKALMENVKSWLEKVADSVEVLYMVDPDTCQYTKVAVRRVVNIELVEFVR